MQLSRLLSDVAQACDGSRSYHGIAAQLSADYGGA